MLTLGRSSAGSYTINNTLLPASNVVNDLGVRVDTKLRFCYHYDNIVAIAHQRASLILMCFQCRDPVTLFRDFCETYSRVLFTCLVSSLQM